MKPLQPEIRRVNLRKASGTINAARSANKIISGVNFQISISCSEPDATRQLNEDEVELRFDLECHVFTPNNSDNQGKLDATVEVKIQVFLNQYSTEDRKTVLTAVWPYLRSFTALQMQIIDLNGVASRLPYQVNPDNDNQEKEE